MINTNDFANPNDYYTVMFKLISRVEGFEPELYDAGDGHATIGYGFDLTGQPQIQGALFHALGIGEVGDDAILRSAMSTDIANMSSISSLQSQLDARMVTRFGAGATFSIDETQAEQVFKAVVDNIYDPRVSAYHSAVFEDVPQSIERAVLVSLSYNGGLGSKLADAMMTNDDRAEAWRRKRYASGRHRRRSIVGVGYQ